jgi:hypothetical protein
VNTALAAHESAWDVEPRKVHVIQGEFHVSDGDDVIMTTILGSCVAACMRDPVARVGGMNHFLLPGATGDEGLRTCLTACRTSAPRTPPSPSNSSGTKA